MSTTAPLRGPGDILPATARRYRDKTALITAERTLTYADATGHFFIVDRRKDLIITAAYKRPRRVVFTDTLPATSSGKIMRRKLAEASGLTG